MTKSIPCMFCGSQEVGGIYFFDESEEHKRCCWDRQCKLAYDNYKGRIEAERTTRFKATGKCYFNDAWSGSCGAQVAFGAKFCVKHLQIRCVICGAQATKTCRHSGVVPCGVGLC